MVEAIAKPLSEAPRAGERDLRLVERAVGQTLEHHAHVQLRAAAAFATVGGPGGRSNLGRAAPRTVNLEHRLGWEAEFLSDLATPSYPQCGVTKGADSPLRTPFQRDRDRIVHSKAFRRLKHKTQVFIAPEGDHYRTRLTHTLEVTQISRAVARALGLNEDLVEAIGLGHDLGHPPFGHVGEDALMRRRAWRTDSG